MTEPTHHVPDAMLVAYAASALDYPFAVLVAAHVSLCDDCRASLEAHRTLGGIVLEGVPPISVPNEVRDRTIAALDHIEPAFQTGRSDIYPAPLAGLIQAGGPRWRNLGFGVKQAILWEGASGAVRMLSIPATQAVPEHGHRGLELTLVLAGAFADETGLFRAGDLEVADEELGHTPRATEAGPCICVAATDAPLRFRSIIPRLLQPIFRI